MLRRRIELDIGCGHGQFAIAAALEKPESLIIGIDINEQSFASAELRRHRWNVGNVQFVHAEALTWLKNFVPSGTIDAVHVYFPTPYLRSLKESNSLAAKLDQWLFSTDFVAEIRRVAIAGAYLRIVTDSEQYFSHVKRVSAKTGLHEIDWSDPISNKSIDSVVGTGCERAMRRLERPILKAQFLIV